LHLPRVKTQWTEKHIHEEKYALVMNNAPWQMKTMRLVEQKAMPDCDDDYRAVKELLSAEDQMISWERSVLS